MKEENYKIIQKDSDDSNPTPKDIEKIKKANYRKGTISSIIYMTNLLFIGAFLNSFNVIQPDITLAYGYTSQEIIWTSTLDLFSAVIFSLFNSIIIEKIGLRKNSLWVSFSLFVASFFKFLLPVSIGFAYLGFLIKGMAGSFALNCMMEFCNVWFDEEKRPFFFGFLSLGSVVGIGLIPFVPFIFLSNNVEDPGILLFFLFFFI